jgi:hypothetical protein
MKKIKILTQLDVKIIMRGYKKEMQRQIDTLRGRIDLLERRK